MSRELKSGLNIILTAVLVFQCVGCGTILYPERKGQKSGKLDAGIVALDGIGLLFFLVPGIIAFAVDFNNGTIYLPGTFGSALDMKDIKQVKFSSKDSNFAQIEKIIENQTGRVIQLDQPDVYITKLQSTDDMIDQFSRSLQEPRDNHIVLNR